MFPSASGLLFALATLVMGFLTTKESSKDAQPTWTKLESADREAVPKELTLFLGEVVGPVFITLSSRLEIRLIGEDTYMSDAYRLHVPDSLGFPTTKKSSKDAQPTWSELESADRDAMLKEITLFLAGVVGPLFITLSSIMVLAAP